MTMAEKENVTKAPRLSMRVQETDQAVIALTRKAMSLRADCLSLAQGIVYWPPPPTALEAAVSFSLEPEASLYGPNEGSPALREALRGKLSQENGLPEGKYNVLITQGANQAFTNVILTLSDSDKSVVLFGPAYFDHIMTVQATGGAANMLLGPRDPKTFQPSVQWLAEMLEDRNGPQEAGSKRARPQPEISTVVICNPCNPTGVLMEKEDIEEMSSLCSKYGTWLLVDNTYEDFVFDGKEHYCPAGPHVISIFSFSKGYGMMGWRVGYIAYPDYDGKDTLGHEFLKCQDILAICAPVVSQQIALKALECGRPYIQARLDELAENRRALIDAVSPLGQLGDGNIAGGQGIYIWAKLPPGCEDDREVVKWMVTNFGVCVVPGFSCHGPGCVRCSFGNLPPAKYKEAAARLKSALAHLVEHGMTTVPVPAST